MAVPKARYILIVEDDPDQADFIVNGLRQRFPRYQIELVETESVFRNRLPEFAQRPPVIAIIDVILRWSDPDQIPPPPPEVVSGGIQKAGLRCEQLLRGNPSTAQVPVIFYSVVNANHFSGELNAANQARREHGLKEIKFLGKEPELETLIGAIRDLLV